MMSDKSFINVLSVITLSLKIIRAVYKTTDNGVTLKIPAIVEQSEKWIEYVVKSNVGGKCYYEFLQIVNGNMKTTTLRLCRQRKLITLILVLRYVMK